MKSHRFFLLLLALLALCGGRTNAQTIDLRISIHVIVDPSIGQRPSGITNEIFYQAEASANAVMAGYRRGYRYRITEITNIGGPQNGGLSGPSKWFSQTLTETKATWAQFTNDATSSDLYRVRTDQINVYVSRPYASSSGGATPIPPQGTGTLVEIFPDNGSFWMLHEMGHFFGLHHTFDGEDLATCTPGDDGITDTLPDSRCWTNQNDVGQYTFGNNYNALTRTQQTQVDDVYFNVMSYHDAPNKNTTEVRLSELQLDRAADHASGDRNAFASGKTWFVSTTGVLLAPGTSLNPIRYPSFAINAAAASGGDIVLIRPGSYNEHITINKPVTLRAPRTGSATIGK
jgi:Pregnancy-associated plasma protein-A